MPRGRVTEQDYEGAAVTLPPDELDARHAAMLAERRRLEGVANGQWECPACSFEAEAGGTCPKCRATMRRVEILNALAAVDLRLAAMEDRAARKAKDDGLLADADGPGRPAERTLPTCKFPGCKERPAMRGLCWRHYRIATATELMAHEVPLRETARRAMGTPRRRKATSA